MARFAIGGNRIEGTEDFSALLLKLHLIYFKIKSLVKNLQNLRQGTHFCLPQVSQL
jgi:hypothetical protein